MKTKGPTLAPLLRSNLQGIMLAQLCLHPEHEFTLTELAIACDTSIPTVMREVDRGVISGFLLERRIGQARLVRPNTANPMFPNLQGLLLYAYGPKPVIEVAFQGLPGVVAAYIFGSWAARYQGIPGADPRDIDLLLIGQINRADAALRAVKASERLGREVAVNNLSEENWDSADSVFVKTVKSRPLVKLDLG